LRDYHNFELHDHNLLVVNAESRFAVWPHMDAALSSTPVTWRATSRSESRRDVVRCRLRLHNDSTPSPPRHRWRPAGLHVVFVTTEPFRSLASDGCRDGSVCAIGRLIHG